MEFLSNINPAYLPFLFILSMVSLVIYRAHSSSKEKFNIFDALSESSTGKASIEKIMILTGGMTVTWWFIDLVASHRATWEDAIAYGGLLGLAKVANTLIKAKYKSPSVSEE